MIRQFSIWIVSPSGYPHSRCFEEVALGLAAAFAELGHDVPVVTDPGSIQDTAIILGANLLPHFPAALPPRCILYNLEQIQADSPWLNGAYFDLLRQHPVWDYSTRNIEMLKSLGVSHAVHCGIGYMPALSRIAPLDETIDVLFVGSVNLRRRRVLEELTLAGLNVHAAYNVYGQERDRLIAAARIVLNLHYYDAQVLEIVRVSYLLANRKCVVSELGLDRGLELPLADGIAFAPYDQLTATCLNLLAQPQERARLSQAGFCSFQALSQVPMLAAALAATA